MGTAPPLNTSAPKDTHDMTDTTTMAPAVATDAVPSTPATEQPAKARDESGRFASTNDDPATPAAEAETPEDGTPAPDADKTEDPKLDKERKKASAKERIDQLTAQKHESNRQRQESDARADRAERRAHDLVQQLQALQNADPLDPATDVRRAVKLENLTEAKAELAEARQASHGARVAEFTAKVDAARDTIADLDQSLQVFGKIPLSDAACDVIASSDKAAEIASFLGKNTREGYRIANLPVYLQTAEIARLEARLSPPIAKTVSTAPKPAPVLGGGSNPMSFDPRSAGVADMQAQLRKAGVLR